MSSWSVSKIIKDCVQPAPSTSSCLLNKSNIPNGCHTEFWSFHGYKVHSNPHLTLINCGHRICFHVFFLSEANFKRYAYFWSWDKARDRIPLSQAGNAYKRAKLKVLQTSTMPRSPPVSKYSPSLDITKH